MPTRVVPRPGAGPAERRDALGEGARGQGAWVETRIVIHVKAPRLELVRGGRVVLRSPIAPGAPETPTPTGRFYVTERLVPKDPNGPWGPAASARRRSRRC